jgi:hypothetical protein
MGIHEKKAGSLDALRARVRVASSAGLRTELSQVLAAAALKQVADEFAEQRDPYGDAWAPLTSRDGQALRDTGASAAAVNAPRADGIGFTINFPRGHMKTHNYGATIVPRAAAALRFVVRGAVVFAQKVVVPKRQIVPDRARGLGPFWSKAFADEARALLRRRLGVA